MSFVEVANQARRISIAAIIIALLLIAVPYTTTTAVLFGKIGDTNQQEAQNYASISAQILALAAEGGNITLNTTIIGSGTFSWTLESVTLVPPSTYTIEAAFLGSSIEFTLLNLSPPINQPIISGAVAQFQMKTFSPGLLQFLPLPFYNSGSGGAFAIPLTTGNLNTFTGMGPSTCNIILDPSCRGELGTYGSNLFFSRNTLLVTGDFFPSNFVMSGNLINFNGLPFVLNRDLTLILIN